MLNIEYMKYLDDELDCLIGKEFNKDEEKNGVTCNYTPFNFIAKENEKVVLK